MDFYEGCSDGTFEIVEDLHFGCIICGEEYIIDKNTLYISVMSQYPPEQGIMNEHYFHGECRCRKCNERLFYRIKAYERPVGRLHHIIDECDDIDWLEKPIVRETGEISRPLHYSRKSQLILEDSRITLPYAGIALNDGNGTIANWEEICEISGRNKPARIVIPTYGNKLVDILLTETGSISYRDNKLALNAILLSDSVKTITTLLGKIAEAVLVRHCRDKNEINRRCLETARKTTTGITFANDYQAIGTGLLSTKRRFPKRYDASDPQRDIIWVNDNGENVLMHGSTENVGVIAGLQVKLSGRGTSYVLPDLIQERYEVPIIYFALNKDFDQLIEMYERKTGKDASRIIGKDIIDVCSIDEAAYDEIVSYQTLIKGLVDGTYTIEQLIDTSINNPVMQNAIMESALQKINHNIIICH